MIYVSRDCALNAESTANNDLSKFMATYINDTTDVVFVLLVLSTFRTRLDTNGDGCVSALA